jgi:hypothetical protein
VAPEPFPELPANFAPLQETAIPIVIKVKKIF